MSSPDEILTTARADREAATAAHDARVDAILRAFPLAFAAIYTAGAAGNVTCRAAVIEVETVLRGGLSTQEKFAAFLKSPATKLTPSMILNP